MENALWWGVDITALILFSIALTCEVVTDVIWARKTLVELREKREKRQQQSGDTTCPPPQS